MAGTKTPFMKTGNAFMARKHVRVQSMQNIEEQRSKLNQFQPHYLVKSNASIQENI